MGGGDGGMCEALLLSTYNLARPLLVSSETMVTCDRSSAFQVPFAAP